MNDENNDWNDLNRNKSNYYQCEYLLYVWGLQHKTDRLGLNFASRLNWDWDLDWVWVWVWVCYLF